MSARANELTTLERKQRREGASLDGDTAGSEAPNLLECDLIFSNLADTVRELTKASEDPVKVRELALELGRDLKIAALQNARLRQRENLINIVATDACMIAYDLARGVVDSAELRARLLADRCEAITQKGN